MYISFSYYFEEKKYVSKNIINVTTQQTAEVASRCINSECWGSLACLVLC